MADREKVINELRFQLDSKEVKDQHYPVQLSASDANAILALLKERESAKGEKTIHYGLVFWACNACGMIITEGDKFCRECGREVKWE